MEAIVRLIPGLATWTAHEADRAWIRITEGFFTAFLIILVGVPIMAHFELTGLILGTQVGFFIVWLVVWFQLKHQAVLAIAGGVYGVPAEGDFGEYAGKVLAAVAKIVFLVLIWAEVYMAAYFHFPALANTWAQVGSAIAVMLVIIPTVIYAVATSKMTSGPWHKPILGVCIALLITIMVAAIPHTIWTSIGINPIWFKSSETATEAQVIREKSWSNLDRQKQREMETLRNRVKKGEVLSKDEYATLLRLQQEVEEGIPEIPPTKIGKVAKEATQQSIESLQGVDKKTLLWVIGGVAGVILAVVLVRYTLANKTLGKWVVWGVVIAGGWWYFAPGQDITLRFDDTQSAAPQSGASVGSSSQFKPSFITRDEWGHLTAKEVSSTGTLGLGFAIIEGSAQGKRPIPFLGIARGDGTKPTIIIARDPDAEYKDFIVEIPYPCNQSFGDGTRGCGTTWRQHYAQKEVRPGFFEHDPGVRGPANLLTDQNGVRWIQLFKDQELYAMYKVIINN